LSIGEVFDVGQPLIVRLANHGRGYEARRAQPRNQETRCRARASNFRRNSPEVAAARIHMI